MILNGYSLSRCVLAGSDDGISVELSTSVKVSTTNWHKAITRNLICNLTALTICAKGLWRTLLAECACGVSLRKIPAKLLLASVNISLDIYKAAAKILFGAAYLDAKVIRGFGLNKIAEVESIAKIIKAPIINLLCQAVINVNIKSILYALRTLETCINAIGKLRKHFNYTLETAIQALNVITKYKLFKITLAVSNIILLNIRRDFSLIKMATTQIETRIIRHISLTYFVSVVCEAKKIGLTFFRTLLVCVATPFIELIPRRIVPKLLYTSIPHYVFMDWARLKLLAVTVNANVYAIRTINLTCRTAIKTAAKINRLNLRTLTATVNLFLDLRNIMTAQILMAVSLTVITAVGVRQLLLRSLNAAQVMIPSAFKTLLKTLSIRIKSTATYSKAVGLTLKAIAVSTAVVTYQLKLVRVLAVELVSVVSLDKLQRLVRILVANTQIHAIRNSTIFKTLSSKLRTSARMTRAFNLIVSIAMTTTAVIFQRLKFMRALFAELQPSASMATVQRLLRTLFVETKISVVRYFTIFKILIIRLNTNTQINRILNLVLSVKVFVFGLLSRLVSFNLSIMTQVLTIPSVEYFQKLVRALEVSLKINVLVIKQIGKLLNVIVKPLLRFNRHWPVYLTATVTTNSVLIVKHLMRRTADLARTVMAPLRRQKWRP